MNFDADATARWQFFPHPNLGRLGCTGSPHADADFGTAEKQDCEDGLNLTNQPPNGLTSTLA